MANILRGVGRIVNSKDQVFEWNVENAQPGQGLVYQGGFWVPGDLGPRNQSFYGNGFEGSFTGSGVINHYARITANATTGTKSLTVDGNASTSDLANMKPGQAIFIHQTQSIHGNHGAYETNYIASISGTTINLVYETINDYYSGQADGSNANTIDNTSTVAQVVASPAYSSVTLGGLTLAKRWDGYTGGILFLTAKSSLDCNGHFLSAWGKGYRGGYSTNPDGTGSVGYPGESYKGHIKNNTLRYNFTGGGGGTGVDGAGGTSAGSGGHAVIGGSGTHGDGGRSIGSQGMYRMHFGGGGGMGGDNDMAAWYEFIDPDSGAATGLSNWSSTFGQFTELDISNLPSTGGTNGRQDLFTGIPAPYNDGTDVSSGGGIVAICCPEIQGLKVTARGTPSVAAESPGAVSGHGASGSIYVYSKNVSITDVTVQQQKNGAGSSQTDAVGTGSAGRIRFDIEDGGNVSGSPIFATGGTYVQNSITPEIFTPEFYIPSIFGNEQSNPANLISDMAGMYTGIVDVWTTFGGELPSTKVRVDFDAPNGPWLLTAFQFLQSGYEGMVYANQFNRDCFCMNHSSSNGFGSSSSGYRIHCTLNTPITIGGRTRSKLRDFTTPSGYSWSNTANPSYGSSSVGGFHYNADYSGSKNKQWTNVSYFNPARNDLFTSTEAQVIANWVQKLNPQTPHIAIEIDSSYPNGTQDWNSASISSTSNTQGHVLWGRSLGKAPGNEAPSWSVKSTAGDGSFNTRLTPRSNSTDETGAYFIWTESSYSSGLAKSTSQSTNGVWAGTGTLPDSANGQGLNGGRFGILFEKLWHHSQTGGALLLFTLPNEDLYGDGSNVKNYESVNANGGNRIMRWMYIQ